MTDKAKTKYLEIPVTFEWTKVFKPEMEGPEGSDYASHGGMYSVDAIMKKAAYKELIAAGSQKQAQVFYEDKWYSEKAVTTFNRGKEKAERMPSYEDLYDKADRVKVKFQRKHDAPFTYGGPPQVAHADGTPWHVDEDGLIGNGSEGILYVSVYESGGFKGTRLNGLQVLNHIPYESDFDPEDDSTGFRMPDRTGSAKPKATKAKAKQPEPEVEEDEIPF